MLSSMGRLRSIIRRALSGAASVLQAPETGSTAVEFHAEMTIEEAWKNHPKAPSVFHEFHLPACDGCAGRFEETLREATAAYELDLEAFLAALNDLIP